MRDPEARKKQAKLGKVLRILNTRFGLKWPQQRPKSLSRPPQEGRGEAQVRPKSRQEQPKRAPRAPQEGPGAVQERPRRGPGAPITERSPGEVQEGPRGGPGKAPEGPWSPTGPGHRGKDKRTQEETGQEQARPAAGRDNMLTKGLPGPLDLEPLSLYPTYFSCI